MKIIKKATIVLIACVMAASCSNRPATSYTIACNLQGIPDSTVIELVPGATYKDEKPVAEGVVTDGKVLLIGVTDEPRLFYIRIAGAYGLTKIMVENGKIRVTGKATKSEQGDDIRYTFEDIVVKGSKPHDLYLQKTASRNGLDSMYRAYHENNKAIDEAIRAARTNKDKALLDSLQTTEAYKKLAADEKQFFETVGRTIKGIIMDSKDSWWGPLLMLDQMSYFTEEQQSWYDEFSQEAKDSYYGRIVEREIPKKFSGKPLPAFTLAGKDGKETNVAAISAGKKYILIDFWASWCAPCRREIPNLKNLYKQYSSKGFEIISISIDKKEADWEKALKEEKLAWPNYLDTKGAADACGVKAIPAMFLIDDKGMVIAEKIRGEALATKLAELFR
jgi:thiol-disulfide isomerase/thioredoxin